MSDTIAAIATSGGSGSIAIVRLSGPDAPSIARTIAPQASLKPRYAELTSLYDAEERLIDRGIVLAFPEPHSFTGETVVEFQCHGGVIIAEEILEALRHAGARLAEPGEFSKRAFLNGKIDLSEAEAIAGLIEAKSVSGARLLARQLRGGLGAFVDATRDALLQLLAHTEVLIDYAEEPDTAEAKRLEAMLQDQRIQLDRIVQSSRRRRGMIEGFRVAIIGKPNVGKSALLNAFLAWDRAIVSSEAGTTRDTIEEPIRIGTHAVRLIDTAGIRDAQDRIERLGVERTLASVSEADVVLALFDGSRPFDAEDQRIVALLEGRKEESVIVAINKNDLPPVLSHRYLERYRPVTISVLEGVDPLFAALERRLDALSAGEEPLLVSARQIAAVETARMHLDEAAAPLDRGELELFGYHVREAIQTIGSITHPYDNSEVLDQMFGTFCLGK